MDQRAMTLTGKRELARLKRAGELQIAHAGDPCLEEYLLQRAFTVLSKIEIPARNNNPERLRKEAARLNQEILAWGEIIRGVG